jgi:tRNA A-37 threonylcarbamoyl transferase component Bud32
VKEIKDSVRSRVRIAYNGNVYKTFHGTNAKERYENEVRVLQYLAGKDCDFVPKLISYDDDLLEICTSNCGQPVPRMSDEKSESIFAALEKYGVRHGDPFVRNITYCRHRNGFCVIDFELAEILDPPESA